MIRRSTPAGSVDATLDASPAGINSRSGSLSNAVRTISPNIPREEIKAIRVLCRALLDRSPGAI
jgi:hypothetical protein